MQLEIPAFAKFSDADSAQMEAVTAEPAKAMLLQAGLLPTPAPNAVVFDNASGPGILATTLFNTVGSNCGVKVVCGDFAEGMVEAAAKRIEENKWNAEAKLADARELPFPDGYFTHNLMNFGIQLIPNSELALKECFRVLQPGGKVGFTAWVHPGWLDDLKAALEGLELPAFGTSPWRTKESIVDILTPIGFTNIDVQPLVFDHRGNVSTFLRFMGTLFTKLLVGENAEKYNAYIRKKYGDGEFTTTWTAAIITADKP